MHETHRVDEVRRQADRLGPTGRLLLWVGAVLWITLMFHLVGCDESTASAGQPQPSARTAAQVASNASSQLVVIETTWRQKGSILAGWKDEGRLGTGAVIADNGGSALVLTSRRLVDPQYKNPRKGKIRDVCFKVRTRGNGDIQYGRLVAVYMNGQDLALLRIGALPGPRQPLSLADDTVIRSGTPVVTIGPPMPEGFAVGEGEIYTAWRSTPAGALQFGLRPTDGPASTDGFVLARQTGQLLGVLRGYRQTAGNPDAVFAVAALALRTPDRWDYLTEESQTRDLLGRID